MSTLIEDAFKKAGGRKKLCEILDVSNATLQDWKRAGSVPAARAAAIEGLTGIPRQKLCPSFAWGPPAEAPAPPEAPTPRRRATDKVTG